MPTKTTIHKVIKAKRQGKAATNQAGEFIKETIDDIREGKIGAMSAKQAIAIGLSKARRAGIDLPPLKKGKTSTASRQGAQRDYDAGLSERPKPVNKKRSRATVKALNREGSFGALHEALSTQAKQAATKRNCP